jgi:hypothetical protein
MTSIRIPLLVALAALVPAHAQTPQAPQTQPAARVPAGLRIDSLALDSYTFHYWGTAGARNQTDWLTFGRASANVGLYFPGTRASGALTYHAGYLRNPTVSTLNGLDQSVALSLDSTGGRTRVSLEGRADSRLANSAIFEAPRSLNVLREEATVDDVRDEFSDGVAAQLADTPIEQFLSGARRRSAAVQTSISRSHSPRLVSAVSLGFTRDIPSPAEGTGIPSVYPAVTAGVANISTTYSLSRRSRISGFGAFSLSESRLSRSRTQSAGIGLERMIGRTSFAQIQGGYARLMHVGEPLARNSYVAGGSLGTFKGFHRFVGTARRTMGDSHGLGTGSGIVTEGAWLWSSPRVSWSTEATYGCERMQLDTRGTLQACLSHVNVSRLLSRNVQLMFSGVYVLQSGARITNYRGTAFLVSCTWSPEIGVRRPR